MPTLEPRDGDDDASPSRGTSADLAAGSGLDARYEQLRHAALHQRGQSFPLGFGVLRRGGVTAWQHALTGLTSTDASHRWSGATPAHTALAAASPLPAAITTELINVLAAVALAGTDPHPPSPSPALARGAPEHVY